MAGLILDVLFPRFCLGCGNEGTVLCALCEEGLSSETLPFAYANPTFRSLLQAWKYHYDHEAGEALRRLWSRAFEVDYRCKIIECTDVIVPIPLSPLRLRERGFNQAEEIARWVGDAVGLPVLLGLRSVSRFGHQAQRSVEERESAMQKSPFVAVGEIADSRVLLVDDVVTTGATARAATRALLAAGAVRVEVFSLGHGG